MFIGNENQLIINLKMNSDQTNLRKRAIRNNFENKPDEKACKLRKKQTTFELFFKSLKFFFLVGVIILTVITTTYYAFNLNPLYPLFLFGVICSTVTTYYKIRMLLDPNYKPDCNCEGAMYGVLSVLEHKKATLLFNIPNSVYGIFFYTFMIAMTAWNMVYSDLIIKALNLISVFGSCWLWYIMITEVKNVCVLCTTIHCINFLSFYYLTYQN